MERSRREQREHRSQQQKGHDQDRSQNPAAAGRGRGGGHVREHGHLHRYAAEPTERLRRSTVVAPSYRHGALAGQRLVRGHRHCRGQCPRALADDDRGARRNQLARILRSAHLGDGDRGNAWPSPPGDRGCAGCHGVAGADVDDGSGPPGDSDPRQARAHEERMHAQLQRRAVQGRHVTRDRRRISLSSSTFPLLDDRRRRGQAVRACIRFAVLTLADQPEHHKSERDHRHDHDDDEEAGEARSEAHGSLPVLSVSTVFA